MSKLTNLTEPAYRRISMDIRDRIISGDLEVGAKLSTTLELCKQWNVKAPTIHAALTPLVKEGLLERRPRHGTFVRKRTDALCTVGLYSAGDALREASPYNQTLFRVLEEELQRRGLNYELFVDSRIGKQLLQPSPALLKAAEQRLIQGVIGVHMDRNSLTWLRRLPLPASFHVSGNESGVVNFDRTQFAQLALNSLSEQGCRSVGLIAPLNAEPKDRSSKSPSVKDFLATFSDLARDYGIEIRDEWMVTRQVAGGRQAQCGYNATHAIWRLNKRPDALVAYPDTVATGVVLAMTELNIKTPTDLRVAFHRNKGTPGICPFPATFIESDESEVARALLNQVELQRDGSPNPRIKIPHQLIPENAFKE